MGSSRNSPDEGSVNPQDRNQVVNTQPDVVYAATQNKPEEEVPKTTIDISKSVTVATQVDNVNSPRLISTYVQKRV